MPCLPHTAKPPRPHAIIFDFDGVIVHSEPLHLRATQEALAARGLTMERDEYYARYVGFHDADMFLAYAADHGLIWCSDDLQELIAAKALRFAALEENAASDGVILIDGAEACVRRLAEIAPLAIASGARREEIERLLARAGLVPLFRTIVAAGETRSGKPAPDPYAEAAARLNAAPARTIAIEDTAAGLASARAAGLRCIGLTTTFPASKLALADVVVERLDEITGALVRSIVSG
jgi:beta-phosphoglucomutase